jgi:hypothetical protein
MSHGTPAPTADSVRERLRPMLAGRPVVLAGGPLASMPSLVPLVTELSGRRPFCLANGVGTGPVPADGDAAVHLLPSGGSDVMSSIRSMLATLADLPADAVAALDAWDPEREAVVLAGAFVTARAIAGRRVLDGRRPEWEALEDKTTVDALWDDLGVRRAPSAVTSPTYAESVAAARTLDRGCGTVWSGDAREGFNGGAEYVRWVRTDDEARAAAQFLGRHCDSVRVAPFLDGLPCSVHGFALDDGVAALRPVEMVVLRGAGARSFVYGGISTYWDPPGADRVYMRAVARTVAHGLRDRHGFRGGFSVDGILTAQGFLPTELNSRFAGGLGAIAKGLPDFPLALVQAALVSGHDPGLTAPQLEELLTSSADAHRWGGGGMLLTTVSASATDTRAVVVDGDRVRVAADDEEGTGELMLGPSPAGGYLRFEPRPGAVRRGASLAPMVASAWALADEIWDTGIGPTEPARPAGSAD